jgi:NhaP-type Na+/H+ and K+/H+ antiporter
MNYISNLFNYFSNKIQSIFINNTNININIPTIITNDDITYLFINTANIYNATEMMFNDLQKDHYNNKYIKIYLLKSHILEPLFYFQLKVNDENIDYIKYELSKQRRYLHTFIDAIESHIEFNNIKNYTIFY